MGTCPNIHYRSKSESQFSQPPLFGESLSLSLKPWGCYTGHVAGCSGYLGVSRISNISHKDSFVAWLSTLSGNSLKCYWVCFHLNPELHNGYIVAFLIVATEKSCGKDCWVSRGHLPSSRSEIDLNQLRPSQIKDITESIPLYTL